MTDTQGSQCTDDTAKENAQDRLLRSLISVLKDNREVLPSLPEMIECLIANDGDATSMAGTQASESSRKSTEKELLEKEKNLEAAEQHMKLMDKEIQEIKTELEIKEKEMEKREKERLEADKQSDEKLSKKEAELQKLRDEYSKDLEEHKSKNDVLRKEIALKGEKIQQYSERLSKKEAELRKLRDEYSKDLEEHKSKNDVLRKEIALKDEKIQKYSERLARMNDDLRDVKTKMNGYKTRLASLSERRVKQDQRLVEDTLGLNRQSELESDFSDFFDEERIDVCDIMQSKYLNKEEDYVFIYYPRLACIILETAYELTNDAKEAAVDLFKELTKNMVDNAALMGKCYTITRKDYKDGKHISEVWQVPINVAIWGDGSKYPKDAMDGMTLSLKEAAPKYNLDSLISEVVNSVYWKWEKWCQEESSCMFSPAFHLLQDLHEYIKACLSLTWRMVTQVPPMKLDYQSGKFNKDIHKMNGYHNSSKVRPRTRDRLSAQQEQDLEIACYLWPGLVDGGGRVIRAGEVLCKFKE